MKASNADLHGAHTSNIEAEQSATNHRNTGDVERIAVFLNHICGCRSKSSLELAIIILIYRPGRNHIHCRRFQAVCPQGMFAVAPAAPSDLKNQLKTKSASFTPVYFVACACAQLPFTLFRCLTAVGGHDRWRDEDGKNLCVKESPQLTGGLGGVNSGRFDRLRPPLEV